MIKNLSTAFMDESRRLVTILSDVNFNIYKGEILGVVGESGSGKSVTGKTIMKLIPDPPGKILNGEILFKGENILQKTDNEMRQIRGRLISMVFQEPMTSLNPVYSCGDQIIEQIILHRKVSRREAIRIALEIMRQVDIPSPEVRFRAYPHEMSGGMRQRIIIAMALSCDPELLIADEPTTALDSTVQAQILELIKSIRTRTGMTIFYITHDLAVVAEICDRVIVMYAGRVMEEAPVIGLFKRPMHPYTQGLIHAMPRMDEERERLYSIEGTVPSFVNMPKGCPFSTRCTKVISKCHGTCPDLVEVSEGHKVRCWNVTS